MTWATREARPSTASRTVRIGVRAHHGQRIVQVSAKLGTIDAVREDALPIGAEALEL